MLGVVRELRLNPKVDQGRSRGFGWEDFEDVGMEEEGLGLAVEGLVWAIVETGMVIWWMVWSAGLAPEKGLRCKGFLVASDFPFLKHKQ